MIAYLMYFDARTSTPKNLVFYQNRLIWLCTKLLSLFYGLWALILQSPLELPGYVPGAVIQLLGS